MYICLDCGKLFEEPKQYVEQHGLDEPPYEMWSGCPYCYESYVETYICDKCGEYITNEYIETEDMERICEECYTVKSITEYQMR